jgi:hypothetical protein
MIFPKTENEALWAAEQCLKSGCCGSVILWHPSLEVHQARRLQVASETGECLNFLFKTEQKHQMSLPISLSMQLSPDTNGIKVDIHKRKGGWLKSSFSINMLSRWSQLKQDNKEKEENNIRPFPPLKRGNA